MTTHATKELIMWKMIVLLVTLMVTQQTKEYKAYPTWTITFLGNPSVAPIDQHQERTLRRWFTSAGSEWKPPPAQGQGARR